MRTRAAVLRQIGLPHPYSQSKPLVIEEVELAPPGRDEVLVRIRAAEKSELIEIEREALQALVETDSELSDIFLRAFILRRLELIAREVGDIVLIGSSH